METFKFTCWNIEHADKLIDSLASQNADTKRKAKMRRDAILEEITALDADILLVSEGPRGKARAETLFDQIAPDYRLITRAGNDNADYGMKGGASFTGRQWIWFLVRKSAPISAQLLHLDQWEHYTEANSAGEHKGRRWQVSYPKWKDQTANAPEHLEFSIPQSHGHWRHPQVLQVEIDGKYFEIIGCHLKSKINTMSLQGEPDDDDFFENNGPLVAELIKARVKITTECTDIRHYIDARFAEDEDAAIIVAGDLNDGPGKERIERRFIYQDLIGALQGNIFFSRRFLNHALFDLAESERWSAFFHDAIDPTRDPHMLLDHIMFSQSMTASHSAESFAYQARRQGGLVEHEVHHRVTSTRYKYAMTSDHKPISMVFDRQVGIV